MNEETHLDDNGINIWKLPDHLCTCDKCHGSGETSTALLPNKHEADAYRKIAGTWENDMPKCLYCNGLGYIERELDTQWDALGITPQQAIADWDAALQENFGEEVLKQIQEIRKQQNEGLT